MARDLSQIYFFGLFASYPTGLTSRWGFKAPNTGFKLAGTHIMPLL
jgi:hypothetical protein